MKIRKRICVFLSLWITSGCSLFGKEKDLRINSRHRYLEVGYYCNKVEPKERIPLDIVFGHISRLEKSPYSLEEGQRYGPVCIYFIKDLDYEEIHDSDKEFQDWFPGGHLLAKVPSEEFWSQDYSFDLKFRKSFNHEETFSLDLSWVEFEDKENGTRCVISHLLIAEFFEQVNDGKMHVAQFNSIIVGFYLKEDNLIHIA